MQLLRKIKIIRLVLWVLTIKTSVRKMMMIYPLVIVIVCMIFLKNVGKQLLFIIHYGLNQTSQFGKVR